MKGYEDYIIYKLIERNKWEAILWVSDKLGVAEVLPLPLEDMWEREWEPVTLI